MQSFRTLWPYFREYRWRLAMGLMALILVDCLQLMIPRVIKTAVDLLSTFQATSKSLAWAGLAIVGLSALIGLFRYVWRQLILGFSRRVEEDLRRRFFSTLLTLPPVWFMSRTTGGIMAHATNDLEAIRLAAGMGQVAICDSVLLGSAAILFMGWIDWRLTLIALIPMPLITLLTRILGRTMHRRFREVQDTFSLLSGEVREYLSGIRVVKALARENLAVREVDRIGLEYVTKNIRLNMVSGTFFPLMVMFTNLSTAMVIYFGGRMTIFHTISPGDFVAFLSYLGLLTWPMMALGWVVNLLQRGAASLDRINAVLEADPGIKDPPEPVTPPAFQGQVEVRNLTFSYPDRSDHVFFNIDLECPAGRITAVVGRTGSGKSTLLNLIPRLLEPPARTVFLDGIPVEDYRLSDLRGAIGYVPQDGYLFSGTIRDNISFGRPDADENRIMAVAEASELAEDIRSFPQGFGTIVGERGVTLSGGQKQRLALARALLMDPALLILDDTLSSVDAAVEEKILARLPELRAGRTTLLTSHRLTSLKTADLIHVIEDGRISQSGLHEDLIQRPGYYAQMYHLQRIQETSGEVSDQGPGANGIEGRFPLK